MVIGSNLFQKDESTFPFRCIVIPKSPNAGGSQQRSAIELPIPFGEGPQAVAQRGGRLKHVIVIIHVVDTDNGNPLDIIKESHHQIATDKPGSTSHQDALAVQVNLSHRDLSFPP